MAPATQARANVSQDIVATAAPVHIACLVSIGERRSQLGVDPSDLAQQLAGYVHGLATNTMRAAYGLLAHLPLLTARPSSGHRQTGVQSNRARISTQWC